MYLYQQHGQYFAQIADGVEDLAAAELQELGASDVQPVFRGAYFKSDAAILYRVNYCARLITRVLAPLERFDCHSTKYLYKRARELPWPAMLTPKQTFAVFCDVGNSHIRHSQYAALILKDAVVDAIRDATGERPSIDTRQPDLWLNLYIHDNRATISIDTSGGSLHRRGYRSETGGAPMQETVAAAILRLTGWNGETPLVDPMCGSGTLLTEALMQACRIPAAHLRKRFGFERLDDFDADLWRRVRKQADGAIRAVPGGLIRGSDVLPAMVAAARANAARLPHGEAITFVRADFRQLDGWKDATIVTNPPYGRRLGKGATARDLAKALGDFLKQRCPGATAFVYFGDRQLVKSVGLRAAWKRPLRNGGLDGRLVRYDLY